MSKMGNSTFVDAFPVYEEKVWGALLPLAICTAADGWTGDNVPEDVVFQRWDEYEHHGRRFLCCNGAHCNGRGIGGRDTWLHQLEHLLACVPRL